jgi:hypothetical protein
MKIYFQKRPEGLFPINDSDKDNFYKIKNGTIFAKDFKLVRNPRFHRLVFSFLNIVFQYQNEFENFDKFREHVTLLAGYYTENVIIDENGKYKTLIKVDSWKFSKMDEYQFRIFFENVKNACWRAYVPNIEDQENIQKIVNELIQYD